MDFIEQRINKAKSILKSTHEGIFIVSATNRRYFSGFESSEGYILILCDKTFLFLDFRYFEAAKIKQNEGVIPKSVEIIERTRNFADTINQILADMCIQRLYFEENRMTVSNRLYFNKMLKGIKLCYSKGMLDTFRASKDALEIETVKKAQAITDKVFNQLIGILKPGMSEREVALEIDYRMRQNGASGSAFSTIAVIGKKTSLPHGVPDDTVIKKGFLTMDFGACFDGYKADMTRTVCFGKPTNEMQKVYQTVLDAQNAAFEKICAGVTGSEVDLAARQLIYNAGYKGCFGHSTGHSVGLEIHENPNFSSGEKGKIPENAIISVEPGIYIEGKFGVRVEDLVLVTTQGYQNFTKSVKELVII